MEMRCFLSRLRLEDLIYLNHNMFKTKLARILCLIPMLWALGATSQSISAPKLSAKSQTDNTIIVSYSLNSAVAKLKPTVQLFRSRDGAKFARIALFSKSKKSQNYTDNPGGSGTFRYQAVAISGKKKSKTSNTATVEISSSEPPTTSGNFDADGNVTATGKTLFGIPSALSANSNQGKTLHQANCVGCHGEKTNRSFATIKSRIAAPPMSFTFADADVANLVAYLNRFRK
jgi:hypothetical protein